MTIFSGSPVLTVIPCLLCSPGHVLLAMIWLSFSCCPVLIVLFWPSCPGWLLWLYRLAVLYWQSCSDSAVLAVLSWLTALTFSSGSPVPTVLLWLFCSRRPVRKCPVCWSPVPAIPAPDRPYRVVGGGGGWLSSQNSAGFSVHNSAKWNTYSEGFSYPKKE